jgi:hypothetical protein
LLRDFDETFTEYSLYTEVYINDKDFTSIAELGAIGLEAALNTQTGFTVWTPKHCLLPGFFLLHTAHLFLGFDFLSVGGIRTVLSMECRPGIFLSTPAPCCTSRA